MTAAIRPTQFSALKPLNPLDQQEQQSEDDDRHGHVEHVGHGHSSVGSTRTELVFSPGTAMEPRPDAPKAGPNATYATAPRFLTETMRALAPPASPPPPAISTATPLNDDLSTDSLSTDH